MRCVNHLPVEAIALCQSCFVCLCSECEKHASRGYVYSKPRKGNVELIDSLMSVQKAGLQARDRKAWFIWLAITLIARALLVGEHLIFGTPTSQAKVLCFFSPTPKNQDRL